MSTHSPYRLRSDAVKVTVSICFCYTLCFFLMGAWLRVKSRSYRWDDAVAVTATVSQTRCLYVKFSTANIFAGTVSGTVRDPVCSVVTWPRKINGVSVHQLGPEPVELGTNAPLVLHSLILTSCELDGQSRRHSIFPDPLHLQRGSSCLSLTLHFVSPAETYSRDLRRGSCIGAHAYHLL
jgi:hypothetical protein